MFGINDSDNGSNSASPVLAHEVELVSENAAVVVNEVSPVKSPSSPQGNKIWQCDLCTFHNDWALLQCKICSACRPIGLPPSKEVTSAGKIDLTPCIPQQLSSHLDSNEPLWSFGSQDKKANKTSWSCKACTYINEGWRTQCEMCSSPHDVVDDESATHSFAPTAPPAEALAGSNEDMSSLPAGVDASIISPPPYSPNRKSETLFPAANTYQSKSLEGKTVEHEGISHQNAEDAELKIQQVRKTLPIEVARNASLDVAALENNFEVPRDRKSVV